jgi:hypothetical protein
MTLNPLLKAKGRKLFSARFLFSWSYDLTGNDIELELERYIDVDDAALTEPACSILCIVGKGYCCVASEAGGNYGWYKVGTSDGLQEVVNLIGGVANSLIGFRTRRFGTTFGPYIIPSVPEAVRVRDAGRDRHLDRPATRRTIARQVERIPNEIDALKGSK